MVHMVSYSMDFLGARSVHQATLFQILPSDIYHPIPLKRMHEEKNKHCRVFPSDGGGS